MPLQWHFQWVTQRERQNVDAMIFFSTIKVERQSKEQFLLKFLKPVRHINQQSHRPS